MAENTLGAPTEGLGQTVTFGTRQSGGVPQASAGGGAVGVRSDLQFSGAVPVNPAANIPHIPKDATMAALARMGEDILAPKLKAAQEQRFIAGMQKAAAGQAITDIVDEQPWYAQLFNSTDVVDGARAYTAFAKSQEVATSLEVNMHKLRELDGPAFAEHVQKQIEVTKTGDAATDAMVFQQAMKQMPHQMAAQAKGHYVWQQERMTEAQRGAMSTALNNIAVIAAKRNSAGQDGTAVLGKNAEITDDLDVFAMVQNALPAFVRPDGMDPRLHSANVAAVISAAASAGNLPGIYALKDAKIIERLQEEHLIHVQKAIDHAESKALAQLPESLILAQADLANMGEKGATPEQIMAARNELNAKFSAMTGSRQPLISAHTTSQELAQAERYRMAKQHRLEAAYAKARTAQEQDVAYGNMIQNGIGNMKQGADPSLKPEEWKDAWATLQSQQPDTVMATRVVQANRNIDKVFADSLQVNVQKHLAAQDAVALDEVYRTQYLPLITKAGNLGMSVANTYAGPMAKQMAIYHSYRKADPSNKPSTLVLAASMAVQPNPDPLTESKSDKAITESLQTGTLMSTAKWMYSHLPNWSDTIGKEAQPAMTPELAADYGRYIKPYLKDVPPGTLDERIKSAAALATANGLTQVASMTWYKPAGASDLKDVISKGPKHLQVTNDQVDHAFKVTVDKTFADLGLSGTPKVVQMPDSNGQARYVVMGKDNTDTPRWTLISSSDIQKSWHAKRSEPVMNEIATIRKNIAFEQDPYYRSASSDARIKAYQKQINDKLTLIGLPAEFN